MNDTKIEPWTEEDTDRAEQDYEAYGAIMAPEGHRIIAEVKRQAAEIERLDRVLANHKALLAAAESAGRTVCDERDAARADLHSCGMELQTCRSTLESERRDGDAQRAEIERLTAELAVARAPTEGRLPDETLLAMGRARGVLAAIGNPSERPPADASLEALFAKWAPLLSPHLNGEQLADLRGDVVRAVDASRQGLTEEQALATAGPLSRDIYNRIGLATGNKIGAPEWMRDAIAAALLRASREHVRLPPGDVSIPRVVLERLAKAAESDPDAREARWAAERILQRAALAAEPARTDATRGGR